jgi:CDP-diacylglycerol--glycerol-3-phosphate 3-phosphatidyltransferase
MFVSTFFHRWSHANTMANSAIDGFRAHTISHPWIGSNLGRIGSKWKILLVQSISVFRILATLCFALLAFNSVSKQGVFSLYCFALVSDLLDGYLARRWHAVTYFGRVMDLVADKSLTIVSLLYAAERGISLFPLALIVTRETITLGLRLVQIEGKQILRTNRIFGGLMATLLGANTLLLLCTNTRWLNLTNVAYWVLAGVFTVNLIGRISAAAPHIARALVDEEF